MNIKNLEKKGYIIIGLFSGAFIFFILDVALICWNINMGLETSEDASNGISSLRWELVFNIIGIVITALIACVMIFRKQLLVSKKIAVLLLIASIVCTILIFVSMGKYFGLYNIYYILPIINKLILSATLITLNIFLIKQQLNRPKPSDK